MIKKYNTEENKYSLRNKKLRHLFVRVFNDDKRTFVRLIGEPARPHILVNEESIISGFFENDNTYCLSDIDKNIILRIDLADRSDEYHEEDVADIKKSCVYKKIFKIRFDKSILFLSGYKYFNTAKSLKNGYPIFSKYNPKIFYDKSYAENVVRDLAKFGYRVEIE